MAFTRSGCMNGGRIVNEASEKRCIQCMIAYGHFLLGVGNE